jgi:hypothetical protein
MTIPATILVLTMGGILTAFIIAGVVMAVLEKQNGERRYHWKPAESDSL